MTEQSQDNAAHHFLELSTNQVLTGCDTCLDGYFLQIQTPCSKETGHVKCYFSGHYQNYGINIQVACEHRCQFVHVCVDIQVACEHRCQFVHVCVAVPGGSNDIFAYQKSPLQQMVAALPIGKYTSIYSHHFWENKEMMQ